MFCKNCGSELNDAAKFCPNCGASVENVVEVVDAGSSYSSDSSNSGNNAYRTDVVGSTSGIAPRNIALAIIFSIITCGIYGIYWFVKITDETNQLSGEYNGTSGLMALVLSLVTCGIYGLYWAYKLGDKTDKIKGSEGGNTGILYIVLFLLGVGIIAYALTQDAVNKAVE